MTDDWTALRWVVVEGPPLIVPARGSGDGGWDFKRGAALWSLQAGAPYFAATNPADYVHQVRTLAVDGSDTARVAVEKSDLKFANQAPSPQPLRAPRLFDVHLVIGAQNAPYRANGAAEELMVNFRGGNHKGYLVANHALPESKRYRTDGSGSSEPGADPAPPWERFTRIVAEPRPDPRTGQRGDFVDQAGRTGEASQHDIRIPPLRLIDGAIRLMIKGGTLPWLGSLDPTKAIPGSPGEFALTFRPDGIEIETAVFFPGQPGRLKGVFLIAPCTPEQMLRDRMTEFDESERFEQSGLTLTLLPRETRAKWPLDWENAWKSAIPAHPSEPRCAIDIDARRDGLPPAFQWRLLVDKTATPAPVLALASIDAEMPPLTVDIPPQEMRVELRGAKGADGTHDGAAALQMTRLRIAGPKSAIGIAKALYARRHLNEPTVPAVGNTVIIAEAVAEDASREPAGGRAKDKPSALPKYWMVTDITTKTDGTKTATMALRIGAANAGQGIPVAHDEHLLAAALRRTLGWGEMQVSQNTGVKPADALPQVKDSADQSDEAKRPIISGFVPLELGWLQLPFPNLPPLDISKDSSLIGALNPTPRSAFDGFIRVAQRPAANFVSGNTPTHGTPIGKTAPWLVTIEGAAVAIVMAAVKDNELVETRAVLREPDLVTRGLVWLSTDRPDALEALPRLGAGPGSFLDLELTTTPVPDPKNRVVTASLTRLSLTFSDKETSRNDLELSFTFNPAATLWARGPAASGKGRAALAKARAVLVASRPAAPVSSELETIRNGAASTGRELARLRAQDDEQEQRIATLGRAILDGKSELGASKAFKEQLDRQIVEAKRGIAAAHGAGEGAIELMERLGSLQYMLDELQPKIVERTEAITALETEKTGLINTRGIRQQSLGIAEVAAANAQAKLAGAGAADVVGVPLPWPAVAWLREKTMAFAAAMPMTRSAVSAVRPLESRSFAPFVAAMERTENGIKLATLKWALPSDAPPPAIPQPDPRPDPAFPELGPSPAFASLAAGWPNSIRTKDSTHGPTEGIPFFAFCVPGVEITLPEPSAGAAHFGWQPLMFAARFDIPALDEAYAISGLPPVPGAPSQADVRQKAPEPVDATAPDWPLMQELWDSQERRRQNSLVVSSYLDSAFHKADGTTTHAWEVKTLIGGATWVVGVGFLPNHRERGLPYGALKLDRPDSTLSGNAALRGLSGRAELQDGKLVITPEDPDQALGYQSLGLRGWSPSTFDMKVGAVPIRVDNQGFGVADPKTSNGIVTRRFHRLAGGGLNAPAFFATAEAEIDVEGRDNLGFWFKDVPLTSGGVFDPKSGGLDTSTDFGTWLDPAEGFEWRLFSKHQKYATEGRDRIRFFGFALEPLRLQKMELDLADGEAINRVPRSVTVLARLCLADDYERPTSAGNCLLLSFTRQDGQLSLSGIKQVDRLQFVFDATETVGNQPASARTRHLMLGADIEWSNGEIRLSKTELSLPLHGRTAALRGVKVRCNPSTDTVTIGWTAGNVPALERGEARLRVTDLTIETHFRDKGTQFGASSLSRSSIVEIRTDDAVSPDPVVEVSVVNGAGLMRILGAKFDFGPRDLREDDNAIVLTLNKDPKPETGEQTLLPGIGWDEARVALTLAARVDPAVEGAIFPLRFGRCEGEIRPAKWKEGRGLQPRRIRWEIEDKQLKNPLTSKTERVWSGFASVSGLLTRKSAIGWPEVATRAGGSEGRKRIAKLDNGITLGHEATYVFDDHRLDFGLCGPANNRWTFAKPWIVFAAAYHVLRGQDELVEWTGIESIAIGEISDLIPEISAASGKHVDADAVTFAGRYRSPFVKLDHHNVNTAEPSKQMIQAGLGRVATVLQGSLGEAFRKRLWETPPTGVIAAAGFLGLQRGPGDAAVSTALLRLPFLAGIDEDAQNALKAGMFDQSDIPPEGSELAWADTGWARSLATPVRRRAPASAREADIVAVVRAGALVDKDGTAPDGRILPALLVEQSFSSGPPSTSPSGWKKAPYWIGSMAAVSAVFAAHKNKRQTDKDAYRPVSLVAGSLPASAAKDALRRGTAAALLGVGKDILLPDDLHRRQLPAPEPALISCGANMRIEPWTGGDPVDADDPAVNGYAASTAAAHHARPLFAVVRTIAQKGNESLGPYYTAVTLPRPISADLPNVRLGSREQTRFADNARGFAVSPGTDTARWLSPVLEGRGAAVRDDDSGLAALGRSLNLPAQAGAVVEGLPDDARLTELARGLIWFTETRIPVYLPLSISGMEAPPISWLQTVPRRVRLPSDTDTALVLGKTGLGNAALSPKRMAAQPFLPAEAEALTVSERAGIVTARRTYLMGSAPINQPFDPEYGRFGRPGQAGASVRRLIRTPRPGPLPVNTGDPERDRRPEASPLWPKIPLRFLVGPADTIRGEVPVAGLTWGATAAWSATFVAAPGSDGVVSDRWDGTVRLRVEFDIAYPRTPTVEGDQPKEFLAPPPGDPPLALFAKVLFPRAAADEPKQARATASLKVGNSMFPLQWITTLSKDTTAWTALDETATPVPKPADSERKLKADEVIVWRAYLDLVLDPRTQQPPAKIEAGEVHAGLAAALAASFVNVELRLTVHPSKGGGNAVELQGVPVALAESRVAGLAEGTDRPPVTLRWELPAVTANRGGLPLLPSTMLFVDPGYEVGLANPPREQTKLVNTEGVVNLPQNRGALFASLSVDRSRVNYRGTVALMTDIRFERAAEERAIRPVDGNGKFENDGDIAVESIDKKLELSFKLLPVSPIDPIRELWLAGARKAQRVNWVTVYELSLASLTEDDGKPAVLQGGDVLRLVLQEEEPGGTKLKAWNSEAGSLSGEIQLFRPTKASAPPADKSKRFGFAIDLTLTNESVVEPPSALYSALMLKNADTVPELSLPLYAQSPLPWRIDYRDLKSDFRKGLVRRSATFVWGLTRSLKEIGDANVKPAKTPLVAAFIVKTDRNGQTHLPEASGEFQSPARLPDES